MPLRLPASIARLALACMAAISVASTAARAALKPGDVAPNFTLEAARGGKVFAFDLAAALKRGPVVLYFYPKSFTSVCTVEAHAFAEAMPTFERAGVSVIGVSGDKIGTQKEFSSKECRDKFPVGADPSLAVIRSYDAGMTIPGTSLGFANRISYVIAPDGKILSSFSSSNAEPHIQNALAVVKSWQDKQKR